MLELGAGLDMDVANGKDSRVKVDKVEVSGALPPLIVWQS